MMQLKTVKWLIYCLCFSGHFLVQGSLNLEQTTSLPVCDQGDTLTLAWMGGLNSPHFSDIDLNGDQIKDLFVFDKDGGSIRTYLNNGTVGVVDYTYAPEYEELFPSLRFFALLTDYNCDGKEDIFTHQGNGVVVYRNTTGVQNGLSFERVTTPVIQAESLSGSTTSLYVESSDVPAIVDVDGDGDMDILTFAFGLSSVNWYENLSIDQLGHCDSLIFRKTTRCWGNFEEGFSDNSISLNQSCSGKQSSGKLLHTGSTVLALDLDNDQDQELLVGDISFENLVLLTNGGTPTNANMVEVDQAFPSYDQPVQLPLFPAAFSLDVNNDGKEDLLVAPNTTVQAENAESIWYYRNNSMTDTTTFVFEQPDFLQGQAVDLGTGAYPTWVDINGDGLLDLLVGNFTYFNDASNPQSQLAYYRNTGSASNPVFSLVSSDYMSFSSAQASALHPAFGDLDGDGDQDMVLGHWDGTLDYYTNTAGAGDSMTLQLSETEYFDIGVGLYAAPQVVDVNEDGLLDLLVGEQNGNFNYFENTGSAALAAFSAAPTDDFFGGIDLEENCCNGHGEGVLLRLPEDSTWVFFTTGFDGKISLYEGIASYLENGTALALLDTLNTRSFRTAFDIADIDGDQLLDVVVGHHTGGLTHYEQRSSGPLVSVSRHLQSQRQVWIFPQPANEVLTIQVRGFRRPWSLEVRDILGKKMFEVVHDQSSVTIGVDNFPPGNYFLKIAHDNDSFVEHFVITNP